MSLSDTWPCPRVESWQSFAASSVRDTNAASLSCAPSGTALSVLTGVTMTLHMLLCIYS